MNNRIIEITHPDKEKLQRLIEGRINASTRDQEHLEMLAKELERAEVVQSAEISPDTVTMGSRVLVQDLDTQAEVAYTLVFPADANIAQGKISILAPIGTALLGYREGDEIEWPTPGGCRRLKIAKLFYQPETQGDERETPLPRLETHKNHGRRSFTVVQAVRTGEPR
jgi:regulator of nucleoside diphosphate kinase